MAGVCIFATGDQYISAIADVDCPRTRNLFGSKLYIYVSYLFASDQNISPFKADFRFGRQGKKAGSINCPRKKARRVEPTVGEHYVYGKRPHVCGMCV